MAGASRQPQGRIAINRSNPLGRKVIEHLPLNGINFAAVSRKPLTFGSSGTTKATTRGKTLRGEGGGARASIQLDLSAHACITVAFWMYWDAYASDDALAMEFTANYNGNAGAFIIDPNAGSNFDLGSNGNGTRAFARPSAGIWHRFAATFDNVAHTQSLAVDGKTLSGNALLTGSVTQNFANSTLYLLSRANNSLLATGNLESLTIYAGALSANELRDDYLNCYQVLEAQPAFPYAALAVAGGTDVSGSITWTEASDGVAAAASVKVNAAASWAEASDTAALSGSVGSAVSISAAWTEASDTAALAGSAQVNVAASWAEQADSISMAGSAGDSVAGNISWTEANDAATIAASAKVNASGAWAEVSDTVAIAASITAAPVVGTIAWTEEADVSAVATFPNFYAFTLMRATAISASGYISGSATQFTLMRSNPLYAASAMSAAPLNRSVNLI